MTQETTALVLTTTRAQRLRLREMSNPPGRDDYDRSVLQVLDDFDRLLTAVGQYPDTLTMADHIAHDMRAGRFPSRSSIETFMAEAGDA